MKTNARIELKPAATKVAAPSKTEKPAVASSPARPAPVTSADQFEGVTAKSARSTLSKLWDKLVERPYVIPRDGFVALDGAGQPVGGKLPGAIIRDRDLPNLGMDRLAELFADGEPREITFSAGGRPFLEGRTNKGGAHPLDAAALRRSGVLGQVGARGGVAEVQVSTPNGEGGTARVLALPRGYDGPVLVVDIDDTLRETSLVDLAQGDRQRPIPGALETLKEAERRGVPIVYLSAGTERIREQNADFLTQLPKGILLDRENMGIKDLLPGTLTQADRQAEYKAEVLGQLKQTFPQAQLFGLGDDKYGDALAYQQQGATAFIRDAVAGEKNLPADFEGHSFKAYDAALRQRLGSALDQAIAQSVSFGGKARGTTTVAQDINADLDRLVGGRRTEGNKLTPLIDGPRAFPQMLEAIRSAKTSVYWETYEWHGKDQTVKQLTDELIAAHQRGVTVRVAVDAIGAREVLGKKDSALERLRQAGIEVAVYNPVDSIKDVDYDRNHRKTLTVDRRVAFVGGLNSGDAYLGDPSVKGWVHDAAIKIEGPAVADVARVFLDTRAAAGKPAVPASELGQKVELPVGGKSSTRIVGMTPRENDDAEQAYLALINNARKSIYVENSYPMTDRLVGALLAAADRGVDVRYILPSGDDSMLTTLAWKNVERLVHGKVRVYDYPGGLHTKAISVDSEVMMVGSSNVDDGSLAHNREAMAVVDDSAVVRELERDLFLADMRKTVEGKPVREILSINDIPAARRRKAKLFDVLIPDRME